MNSKGQGIDESYVFELGAFTEGFVPSLANVSQWITHWHGVQRAIYDPSSQAYTNRYDVESNDSPYSQGSRGYVWGYGVDTNEWILMTDAMWTWPKVGGTGFPVSWSTRNATDVKVGSVLTGGGLKTQDVGLAASPILGPKAWRQQVFTPAEGLELAVSGWDADPDEDGYSNLDEYALGGNPRIYQPNLALSTSLESPVGSEIRVTLTRDRTRFATARLQHCLDLVSWEFSAAVERGGLDGEEALIPWIDRLFVRVRVEPLF